MKLLNRSAFAIIPKQPFVDWANSLTNDVAGLNETLSLSEHQQEGTVYLIDEVESEQDFQQAIERFWPSIFENELSAWDEMADAWPDNRTLGLFMDWFEFKPQVMALDLVNGPLMTATLD
ncbi:MAG: hypothetical protein ACPGF7_06315 [Pontibacterium sp.]